MKIGPLGTVCYRLLVEPELGTGLGNTVFVGLELRDADDHAELMFSGLERRIEIIRGAGQRSYVHGHLFSIDGPTNARDLASAMASMRRYAPELVLGKELVERSRKRANAAWDAARAAIEQFNAGVAIDARCAFCNEQPLVVDRVPAETPTQWFVGCPCKKSSATIKGLSIIAANSGRHQLPHRFAELAALRFEDGASAFFG